MRRVLASIAAVLAGAGIALAAVLVLLRAALYVEGIGHALAKVAALAGLLAFGVIVLLGSVYLATQLAVRLWGDDKPGSA